MQIILERHAFAPELNVAYIGPHHVKVKAPGCTSIREVREKLFAPVPRKGRYVRIKTKYPEPYNWLDRSMQGFCDQLTTLKAAIEKVRSGLATDKNPRLEIAVRIIG